MPTIHALLLNSLLSHWQTSLIWVWLVVGRTIPTFSIQPNFRKEDIIAPQTLWWWDLTYPATCKMRKSCRLPQAYAPKDTLPHFDNIPVSTRHPAWI
jgi:hypothetical protein